MELSPQKKQAEKKIAEAAFEELEATRKPILLLPKFCSSLKTEEKKAT
jgi:hypothetical protein